MSSTTCIYCKNVYSATNNLNKHLRIKHADVYVKKDNSFTCNDCGETFTTKTKIKKHISSQHSVRSHIKCFYENCELSFKTLNSYTNHLTIDHKVDIKMQIFNFNTMEEFQKWKTDIENEEKSQYIRNTSKKQLNGVEYLYYVCHRSNNPRFKGRGLRASKSSGSIKIGKVCPSQIRVHIRDNKLMVQYWSTHLWHDNEIRKQRLQEDDRTKLAGCLALGIPVQQIIKDVREKTDWKDLKRVNLLEKRDLYNIKRDYKINAYLKRKK